MRNDGSFKRLETIVSNVPSNVFSVPDNGFNFNLTEKVDGVSEKWRDNLVGLSITNDLFTRGFNGTVTTNIFNKSMISLCNDLLDRGRSIIFFLHAPQDIETFYYFYSNLDKSYFRSRIKVAAYDAFSKENAYNFDQLYRQCRYVIAMRFHANILAIKNCTPVIGFAGHEQIAGLYEEIGLMEQCVIISDGFQERVKAQIDKIEHNSFEYVIRQSKVHEKISSLFDVQKSMINDWLTMVQNNSLQDNGGIYL